MNLMELDNPVWHALTSHHAQFAIRGDIAVRYPTDVLFAAAMPEYDEVGFNDLSHIVAPNERLGILGGLLPPGLFGWKEISVYHIPQLVCENLEVQDPIDVVELTLDDAPEMLDLVTLTKPGPFLERTVTVGRYIGVRQDGKLVAMAGERFHLNGFCEVSAVCTHLDYQGRGYASRLTSMMAQHILDRNETPFLHLMPSNSAAMHVYGKLGFRKRRELPFTLLKRIETE